MTSVTLLQEEEDIDVRMLIHLDLKKVVYQGKHEYFCDLNK